jgi:hypothetical protein
MKVGTTEYLEATGLTAFREALTTQLGTHLPQYEKLLGEISSDMFNEKLVFADWPALLAEVAIRNVGYQAEAAMRARMVEHEARAKRQLLALAPEIEKANQTWAEDRKKPLDERHFRFESEMRDYCAAKKAEALSGVLSYCKASYMVHYSRTWRALDMFRWVVGETEEKPLRMNCWEGVIFSLIETDLVDKTYMGWCNKWFKKGTAKSIAKDAQYIMLFQQLINDMDYYWGEEDSKFGANIGKKRPSQSGFVAAKAEAGSEKALFLVPQDTIIPRGRILMFNCGAHVAISTGKLVPVTNEDLIKRFKITVGHGMLELDSQYPDETITIREGIIEDLYLGREFYLGNMVVAPFPKCREGGTITLTGETESDVMESRKDVSEVIEAYRTAHSEEIEAEKARARKSCADKLSALKEQQKALLERTTEPATAAEIDDMEKQLQAISELENSQIKTIDVKWNANANNDAKVKAAKAAEKAKKPIKETITFTYNINNPEKSGE